MPHPRSRERVVASAAAVLLSIFLPACVSVRPSPTSTPSAAAQQYLVRGLDSLRHSLTVLDREVEMLQDTARAIRAFRDARRAFKQVESLLTYYIPIQTATINGPRLEADDDDPAPPVKSAPIGFQVIEAALFDGSVPVDSARVEILRMRQTLTILEGVASTNPILPNAALDAVRLQLARVATVGLAGIDADPSVVAIIESAHA